MNIISFPKIFNGNSTAVKYGDEATKQSIRLLLSCECGEFFGDPAFGIHLKRYFFEQNNVILRDILIDELYTKIVDYCPQVYIERNDIKIFSKGNKLIANITYKNQETFVTNMFSLVLFKTEGSE
jgi:phage baseplate assembly protein W